MYSIDNAYAGYHDRLHRVYSADMKAKDATRGMMRVNGGEYFQRLTMYNGHYYIEVVVVDIDGNGYSGLSLGKSFKANAPEAYALALAKMERAHKQRMQQQADELLAIALTV